MILLDIVALALIVFGIVSLASWAFGVASRKKEPQLISTKDLSDLRLRARLAEQGLRRIANGAGNPLIEAQSALDSIENTYEIKELN